MKLATSTTETNSTLEKVYFSVNQTENLYQTVTHNLYSNPILAIIRETLCNAYDSQVEAGTEDTPISVTLPIGFEDTFAVRDYGTGLSKDDVVHVYTTFFLSTKSDSNDLTGGFGLGSKSPFAYTSSFTVVSFFEGKKYTFLVTIDNGAPCIMFLTEEDTKEHNGLLVTIPIDKDNGDSQLFIDNFYNYIQYFPEFKLEVNGTVLEKNTDIPVIYKKDNVTIYTSWTFLRNTKYCNKTSNHIFIKQGQNIYPVSPTFHLEELYDNFYYSSDFKLKAYRFYEDLDFVIEVPIGTLSVTPGREFLMAEKKEKTILSNLFKSLTEFCTNNFKEIATNVKEMIPNSGLANRVNSYYWDWYEDKNPAIFEYLNYYTNQCFIKTQKLKQISADDWFYTNWIPENKEVILLFTPSFDAYGGTRKFRRVLYNYPELNDKHILFMPFTGKESHYRESKYPYNEIPETNRQFMNRIKEYAWTLNNMEEFNFNITCMTVAKFYHKYFNDKLPRKERAKYTKEERERNLENTTIRYGIFTAYRSSSSSYSCMKTSYDTATIRFIHNTYNKNNTIILTDNSEIIPLTTLANCINVVNNLPEYVDNTGKHTTFLYEFISNIVNNTDADYLNILNVTKTNMKYFSDYTTIDISELGKFFKFHSSIRYVMSSSSKRVYVDIDEINKDIKALKKKPLIDYVINSFWYKKMCTLSQSNERRKNLKTINEHIINEVVECLGITRQDFEKKIQILGCLRRFYTPKDEKLVNILNDIGYNSRGSYFKAHRIENIIEFINLLRRY